MNRNTNQTPAHQAIVEFLANVRALDDSKAWGYFLDLLDEIEIHRETLRRAEWPPNFPALEADTYRAMLIPLERDLRDLLAGVPLEEDEQRGKEAFERFAGFFRAFVERADAVSERLAGPRMH